MICNLVTEKKLKSRRFVFLDRDGTINTEQNYLFRIEDLRFERNAVEGLRLIYALGYNLVIVTNQSGIARGYYSVEDFEVLQLELMRRLEINGVNLLGHVACPHMNDCKICRKPNIGMLNRVFDTYDVDLSNSWMIGDKDIDLIAGVTAGLNGALVETGHAIPKEVKRDWSDFIFRDLLDFANFLKGICDERLA